VLALLQAEWPELLVTSQRAGGGFANAINMGIGASESARVGLLLSDDWLLPEALETCLRQEADIVSTGLSAFAADGYTPLDSVSVDLKLSTFESLHTLERKANYLSHFFLWRKAKVEEVGGLDESLGDAPGIDDYDFVWTLLEHKATVAIVEERLYCYRDHDQNRLTLIPTSRQTVTLSRILAKHGVEAREAEGILKSHGRWFGKPIHVAQAGLPASQPLEKA
jgi:hypothetical protein